MRRANDDVEFVFLMNFTDAEVPVQLVGEDYVNAMTEEPLGSLVEVPARGVVVSRR